MSIRWVRWTGGGLLLLLLSVVGWRLSLEIPERVRRAGESLVDRADIEGALAVLDAVLAASTGGEEVLRDVRYHKAVLLENTGRREEAREIFRDIQEKTPGYRDVESRLKS